MEHQCNCEIFSPLYLGPTFIKVGQLSSTRSDLFPPEFIQELSKLQDRVPAFSAERAMAIIEKDLGQPVGKLFQSFDRRPIAAASLGQVHRATLWSGEEVVVKVQRPGLKQLFDIDLDNLRILAEQLDKQDEANDFKGIYQECASVLYQEIDYINEGRNSDRFRRNFKDIPWVRVPIVYWEYSSPRVLTLQYLPGVRITDNARLNEAGVELKLVAKRATEAYLLQILKHGFYHADPHPGNVSVDITPGPYQGALLFYDFGMMGDIIPNIREKLLEVFYGIYRKDANQVIRALTDLQVIRASGDQLSLRRSIAFFIDNLARQTERQETIANIGEDLFAIALDQPFRFPANFTFVLRAFSTLEGIGKTLDPDYKFSELVKPYAQELLDLQNTADSRALIINQVQQQASELTSAAAAMPLRIQRIDALLEQLELGDIKLRVRALEVERSMRRSALLQSATMSVVGALGSLNLGAVLAMGHAGGAATPMCIAVSLVCGLLTLQGLQRVKRMDKFEKDIKGGA
ncbi:hypothetical protein CEUSTIGMA_g13432.t1 [Chlamydomonas eustigma]|uniref:ABC1 atypical kinase-like domain-containing protein n=1 Tax=Chlamydomonas eustigma TaxID=1157962 RepID=A0A250XSG6_9CHLO|nr:hypothetical protein CEUSTIGMA_g13432.t1 [Chlamydomonas eustigma]|eukprot:GAX86017.1 hypothetical protein CEUSTIGMA_g13432.t1 [Chlamydomonas eustigma]